MADQKVPTKKIKKGDILIAEGDPSKSMYVLLHGIVRIYKKRGETPIEIDTVNAGQLIGEMSFLDGSPRSATAEALTECELVEISSNLYEQKMASTPDWLKNVIKALVGRMRSATTKIKQIETASSSLSTNRDGEKTFSYIYLSTSDCLKIASAILLSGARHGTKVADGLELKFAHLQRYANQIGGVPAAKVTSFAEILGKNQILSLTDAAGAPRLLLKDIDTLENYIAFTNEQNLQEEEKRKILSLKGFLCMSYIAKYLNHSTPQVSIVPESDPTRVRMNLAEIRKVETAATGKEPFRLDDFTHIATLGYASGLELKSGEEAFTTLNKDEFTKAFKLERIFKTIDSLNDQKRKQK